MNWTRKLPLNEFPEWQHSLNQTGGAFGGVPSQFIVEMDVEIADVDDHWVAISHVRDVVPPLAEPAGAASSTVFQSILKLGGEG